MDVVFFYGLSIWYFALGDVYIYLPENLSMVNTGQVTFLFS